MDFERTAYLSGFVDGEGCFQIYKGKRGTYFYVRLRISQRLDSRLVLDQLRETFGGWFVLHILEGERRDIQWTVGARKDILRLISYFDEFPLVVKADEYEIWREATLLYYRYSAGKGNKNPPWLLEAMQAACTELSRLKEYQAQVSELDLKRGGMQLELIDDEQEAADEAT